VNTSDGQAGVSAETAAAGDGVEDVDALFPELYAELRGIARAHRRRLGRSAATLSTTALVNEAYVRLRQTGRIAPRDRSHFLALSARVMRFVLIDHARRALADKRDRLAALAPGAAPFDPATTAERALGMLALDEALGRLAAASARMARVVECRFFGGLTEPEIAEALGISERTVRSEWQRARIWLAHDLGASTAPA
jgi:RNA polymerase sigma factor (TIGR02999 family)